MYRTQILENLESFPNPNLLHQILTATIEANDRFGDGKVDDSLWFMVEDVETIPEAEHYRHADGGGNDWDAVFLPDGSCLVYGFDHETVEATVSDEQPVFGSIPDQFKPLLSDEGLVWSDTGNLCASIAFWWDVDGQEWECDHNFMNDNYQFDDGGYDFFFQQLTGFEPASYTKWWVSKTGAEKDTTVLVDFFTTKTRH